MFLEKNNIHHSFEILPDFPSLFFVGGIRKSEKEGKRENIPSLF